MTMLTIFAGRDISEPRPRSSVPYMFEPGVDKHDNIVLRSSCGKLPTTASEEGHDYVFHGLPAARRGGQ